MINRYTAALISDISCTLETLCGGEGCVCVCVCVCVKVADCMHIGSGVVTVMLYWYMLP